MSEAVHEVAHERTHEAAHGGGHGGGHAKMIGLLISLLALCLAVAEMLGKSAQTEGLALNIQASDTWNFFQAKNIRATVVRTAVESSKLSPPVGDKEIADKQLAAWQANVDRWQSDPKSGEGAKELAEKAQHIEHERDEALHQYHAYEIVSLVLQLGIVLASVALLSQIMAFAWGSALLGAAGAALLAGAYLHLPFVNAVVSVGGGH